MTKTKLSGSVDMLHCYMDKQKQVNGERAIRQRKRAEQRQINLVKFKIKEMTYKTLAENLIFDGYFMPELSWQIYEEDLRWDWHIKKEILEQYAKEHNIKLKETRE